MSHEPPHRGAYSGREIRREDLPERTISRFWSRVGRRGPDECWPFDGPAVSKCGHRTFNGVLAHRLAYAIEFGLTPAGKTINHHCDQANCVNFRHLYCGTQGQNMADARDRGRFPHYLDWETVEHIRTAFLAGAEPHQLAAKWGISTGTVRRLVANSTYKNPAYKPRPFSRRCGVRASVVKLSDEVVLAARARRAEGESVRSIAGDLGVAYSTTAAMLDGTTWQHLSGAVVLPHGNRRKRRRLQS